MQRTCSFVPFLKWIKGQRLVRDVQVILYDKMIRVLSPTPLVLCNAASHSLLHGGMAEQKIAQINFNCYE